MTNQSRAKPGQLIWDYFFFEFTKGAGYWLGENGEYLPESQWRILSAKAARKTADEVAANYGANRTHGIWG